MRKNTLIAIISLITIYFSSITAYGQSYNIYNYTVKNGLPSGKIYDLVQDSYGKMWFASNIGILEFDNISWKTHNFTDLNWESSEWRWLVSDKNGSIFVFHRDLAMGGYQYKKKWDRINGPESKQESIIVTGITKTEIDGKTIIGFGTYKKGLYLYTSGKWRHFTQKDGLLDNDIISIDSYKGKFYVISQKGISIVSNKLIDNSLNKILPNKDLKLNGIKVIEKNSKKIIWITGNTGIGKISDRKFFKIKDFDFRKSRTTGSYLEFRKILIEYDKRGRLFFGNINTLYFMDLKNKNIKQLSTKNGTTTKGITSILQDRELNIWTSTKNGINKIVSLQFENYSMKNGLLEDEVCSITNINPDIYVFGHNNGLTIKKGNTYRKIQLNSFLKEEIFNPRVFEILIDSKKNMWVAAGLGGLFLFDTSPEYNFIKHWKHDISNGFVSITEDKQNNIWVAGNNGIWKIINKKLIPVKTGNLDPVPIRKIYVTDDNSLYFATISNGIYTFKNNLWKQYYPNKKHFNSTYSVNKYQNKSLLIGSAGGLLELKNEQISLFSKLGWEITRPVYFITKDKQNNYWIGTNNGVIKFNKKTFKHFTYINGLVGIETNRGGGFVDNSGDVWIGMEQGVSKFTPDMYDIHTPKPLLYINSIKINNIAHKLNTDIIVHGKNSIEFYFNGISFIDSNPLEYIYKLNGYDKKWNRKTLENGLIRYDNLPRGKYSFLIKVVNSRGIESDFYSLKNIEIIPPFYLTYWFFLIILSLLLLSSFLFRKYFTQIKISNLLKNEIYRKNIQLKESLISYQSLFEESLDCIFTSTPDGMFLSINQAGLDMFGYKNLKDISRKKIQNDIYVDKNRREEFKKLMKSNGFVKNFESNVKNKKGRILTVIESSYLIKNNKGEIIGYRGIVKDITDQHVLQTQLVQAQKMESIGLLAGGIAHDFNNILSGILGYANLLKRSLTEDKKLFKYINTIEKSAERAADLTKKLLGFARKGKYKVTLIDINETINEVTNLLHPIIDKSISIELDLIKPSSLIEADASQIQQVIMNICLNARDALPNGGTISITSEHLNLSAEDQTTFSLTALAGKYLRVSIIDDGFGISKDNLQKIFDPFFTTKKIIKGSGLGLSMVYGVMKNHNGALNVKSGNKGTSFELYFPRKYNKKLHYELGRSDTSDSKDLSKMLHGNETILIIDDEEVHRELLSNILSENGYKTIEASDGIIGLELYSKHRDKISAIILDMSMPKMGGSKTFIKLREISSDIKVLVNSGYSMDDNIQTILNHNGTDFIQKPFKSRHLLIKIKALIGIQSKQ